MTVNPIFKVTITDEKTKKQTISNPSENNLKGSSVWGALERTYNADGSRTFTDADILKIHKAHNQINTLRKSKRIGTGKTIDLSEAITKAGLWGKVTKSSQNSQTKTVTTPQTGIKTDFPPAPNEEITITIKSKKEAAKHKPKAGETKIVASSFEEGLLKLRDKDGKQYYSPSQAHEINLAHNALQGKGYNDRKVANGTQIKANGAINCATPVDLPKDTTPFTKLTSHSGDQAQKDGVQIPPPVVDNINDAPIPPPAPIDDTKKDEAPAPAPEVKKDEAPAPTHEVKKDEAPAPAPEVKKDEAPAPTPEVKKDEAPAPAPVVKKDEAPTPTPEVKKDEAPAPAPEVKKDEAPAPAPEVKKDEAPAPAPEVKKDEAPAPAPEVKKDEAPAPAPAPAPEVKKDEVPAPAPEVKKDEVPAPAPEVKKDEAPAPTVDETPQLPQSVSDVIKLMEAKDKTTLGKKESIIEHLNGINDTAQKEQTIAEILTHFTSKENITEANIPVVEAVINAIPTTESQARIEKQLGKGIKDLLTGYASLYKSERDAIANKMDYIIRQASSEGISEGSTIQAKTNNPFRNNSAYTTKALNKITDPDIKAHTVAWLIAKERKTCGTYKDRFIPALEAIKDPQLLKLVEDALGTYGIREGLLKCIDEELSGDEAVKFKKQIEDLKKQNK